MHPIRSRDTVQSAPKPQTFGRPSKDIGIAHTVIGMESGQMPSPTLRRRSDQNKSMEVLCILAFIALALVSPVFRAALLLSVTAGLLWFNCWPLIEMIWSGK